MSKITKKGNHIFVPDHVTIPYIEGDGVGHEITPVSQKIVNAAIKQAYNGTRSIEWKEVLAGEKAFKQTGSWLPDETMEAFREYIVGIKGPLTTPIGGGIRSLNVALRQTLDLYVCLRPVRWFKGVVSPVKEPQKVNIIRTAQAATEQFFSILIPKASYMSVNCPEATRKLQTTGWS